MEHRTEEGEMNYTKEELQRALDRFWRDVFSRGWSWEYRLMHNAPGEDW